MATEYSSNSMYFDTPILQNQFLGIMVDRPIPKLVDDLSFTINETYNLGLLPEKIADRTKVRALAQTLAIDVHPVCNLAVTNFAVELSGSQETRPIWIKSFIEPGLKAFETLLGAFEQSPYCTGSDISVADVYLMPQIYNANRWGTSIDKYPRIVSVVKACNADSAFVAAHPDNVKAK